MAPGNAKERPTHVGRSIIIGVGNPLRGDDAVGPAVCAALENKLPASVGIATRDGEATGLMETWKNADAVILVDAVSSGSEPGTIHEIDVSDAPVPQDLFRCSTHSFGVAEAVELSRAMKTLPRVFWIIGIEGTVFDHGAGLSRAVEAAVDGAAGRVLERLAKMGIGNDRTNRSR